MAAPEKPPRENPGRENVWKATLNLPDTAFPMKANLVQREPEILSRWRETDLYARIRAARKGAPSYVFHDGPPYANGEGHVGTFRIKILKDATVRFRTMKGFDAPFVPGWDCHGLPIEHNVMKELGSRAAATPAPEVRKLCRAYAERFVGIQRDNYARFGVLAEWKDPYLTMSPDYEAGILDVWADMVEKGYVTRGLRSIHWCVTCRTALAEAELEYAPETSSSVHVRFAVEAADATRLGGPAEVVIWTTTPWTLPANVAVAVHPKLQYAVVEHDGPDRERRAVVALPLVEKYLAAVGATDHTVPTVIPGAELRGLRLRHPFLERVVPVVLADYVSAEDGTGCVHTAPGHGADDFATGKREGLAILCPVGPGGLYTEEVGVPSLVGTHVFKADEPVIALLRERGALAAHTRFEHSYPHCWRCHKPVIFRATDQWFISVDHERLRERAIAACENDVAFFPKWGRQRIVGMLRERPDWCVSRQRIWGVPIPALYCEGCGKVHCTAALVRHVRDLVAREGADTWFTRDARDLAPPGLRCECGGSSWRKETDIFDVWFESGSSWRSVLDRPGHRFPADLYMEAQDQHRGWFQTSLLPAMAVRGRSPFRECVTHGFFTDDAGDKVSKSKGGMAELSAAVLTQQIGADITRLFFASANYFEDIAISRRLMEPTGDQYRKIRNTLRFLLGAVNGYDAARDAVPAGAMPAIDRWAVAATDDVAARVDAACTEHDFCRASQILREFMDSDLSAFYCDLVKDRLYCSADDAAEYRSVRTALAHVVSVLVRLWAPILPFTCEEAWGYLPASLRDAESVHLAGFPSSRTTDAALLDSVARLRRVRGEIQRRVDPLRKSGEVGSNQDVAVEAELSWDLVSALPDSMDAEQIVEALGVSELDARLATPAPAPSTGFIASLGAARSDRSASGLQGTEVPGLSMRVRGSTLHRCERCRRRRPDAAVRAGGRDALCLRCEAWRSRERAPA